VAGKRATLLRDALRRLPAAADIVGIRGILLRAKALFLITKDMDQFAKIEVL
jgi:hypothetical protein